MKSLSPPLDRRKNKSLITENPVFKKDKLCKGTHRTKEKCNVPSKKIWTMTWTINYSHVRTIEIDM